MLKTYDIFISYAETDGDWVRGYLIDALEAAKVNYCSEEDFRLGVPWLTEFERCVKQSRQTLLILSPAYITKKTSEFVDLLSQVYGLETGTWPVIPLVLHPVKLPSRLKQLTGLDATHQEQWPEVIQRLCNALSQQLPNSTPRLECPYPGMVPFSEAQSDRFFGREQEVEELLEKLRLYPFIAVIGPSGSGKSSLVYAGLIPKLESTGLLGSGEWLILDLRPGETPLTTLKTILEGDLENSSETVSSLLQRHQAQRLFLLVDQFEETFTRAEAESIPFQHQLLKLMRVSHCYILLTVRADFYPDLMQSPLWRKIESNRIEVVSLDDEGLKQAILKPAEAVDAIVESALVERLITDAAGEPGVLPFIQETLVVLWEKLERRFLPLTAYEQLVLPRKAYGGVRTKKLTGLQIAIARRADVAIADLTEEQQLIARRVFIRLIQFGEGRADTRRRQLVNELQTINDDPKLFQQTLDHLIGCRLLTSNRDENNRTLRTVDIAHEALITGWPTLQSWIVKHQEAEQTRRRLLDKAEEWEHLGKGIRGLLDELGIQESERWLASTTAIDLSYEPLIDDLIEASKSEVVRVKNKRTIITSVISILSLIIVLASGIVWNKQIETQNMQTTLDVQLGNFKPETLDIILPILENYIEKAKESQIKSQNNPEKLYEGISYSRAALDLIFRIENFNFNLQEGQDNQRIINNLKKDANLIIEDLILQYGIPKIEAQLKAGKNGDLIKETTYLRYEEKFTPESALKATYEVIMIDLGADINRIGTLSPNESKRIPCQLLKEIDELWRSYTNNQCGWFSSQGHTKGGECSKKYPGYTLYDLIFPQISWSTVKKHFSTCPVHSIKYIDRF